MNRSSTLDLAAQPIRSLILNIIAVTFIFFVPAISHLLKLPVYLIEPMRVMLVLAMVHTNRTNAYILALGLPVFSFLVSGHPIFFKMVLIAAELSFNVWLFYRFRNHMNAFFAVFSSIIISKAAYYLIKFGLISFVVLQERLISTPLYFQLITVSFFSLYAWLILRNKPSV